VIAFTALRIQLLVSEMYINMYIYVHMPETLMTDATFTELRNHAKRYFDAVEAGDIVRVFRNGKPIAEIMPIRAGVPSWKRQIAPLTVKGLSLSREILGDRDDSE
jgi:prevent-host-death family protein